MEKIEYASQLSLTMYKQEKIHLTKHIEEPKETYKVTGKVAKYGSPAGSFFLTLEDDEATQTYRFAKENKIERKDRKLDAFMTMLDEKMKNNETVTVTFNTKDDTLVDLL
jgi:hypothetical protein